jgi:hypothetical protein
MSSKTGIRIITAEESKQFFDSFQQEKGKKMIFEKSSKTKLPKEDTKIVKTPKSPTKRRETREAELIAEEQEKERMKREQINQPDEHALECAYEFMNFLFKTLFSKKKGNTFAHVRELIDNNETEKAVLTLSEIVRGPRFTNSVPTWIERITFWMTQKWEYEPEKCSHYRPLPHLVFNKLITIVAFDEDYLHSLVDVPMLK